MNLEALLLKKARILTAAVLCISIAVSAAACQVKKNNTPKQQQSTLTGKIKVYTAKETAAAIKLSADNFKKKNPKVEIEIMDSETQDYYNKLSLAINSIDNIPDVILSDDDYIRYLISTSPKAFEEMGDTVSSHKGDYLSNQIDNVTIDGKIYGMPFNSNSIFLYYRDDLFSKSGINVQDIKTWDDFIEVGKSIFKTTGTKLLPINLMSDDFYRQRLNQLGLSYFDKDGKLILDSDKSIRSLGIIKRIVDENIVYNIKSSDSILDALKKGNIASAAMGTDFASQLKAKAPELRGKIKIMKLPAFEEGGNRSATLGGTSLMIPAQSKNKKLAIEFCKFASLDRDNLINLANNLAIMPAYTPIYDDALFYKQDEYFGGQEPWVIFKSSNKFLTENNYGDSFPIVENALNISFSQGLLKSQDLKKDMETMEKSLATKINKH